jgi:alpha-galactosidase
MIEIDRQGVYALHTRHTTYCFRVIETGQLQHLYYGRKIHTFKTEDGNIGGLEALFEKHEFAPGNTNVYDDLHRQYSLEDMCLEMSSYGKGDIREPFIELVHADGSMTSDFCFESFEVTQGKQEFKTLPGSYDEENKTEHLCVTLKDKQYDIVLELHYYIYEDCDVITRSARVVNESGSSVFLKRIMSTQLDFDTADYCMTMFHGAWAREMQKITQPLKAGMTVNSSYTGTSSNRANPFVMLHKKDTGELQGEVYGFNLIYSGNHYEAAEVGSFGKLRFVSGINPQSFSFCIMPGEDFEAPESVMTYSYKGFGQMSNNMHEFVREHIVRGTWKKKNRPVLLNSWEAAYFDINEKKLLQLAKAGKEAGIELFVMDDGWFGSRNSDTESLGDWVVNEKKLPKGLSGLSQKIKEMGLDFGIWVEPEMVNVNSDLYRKHPDWAVQIGDKPHSEGRNQRILDLTRREVQDFVIETMSNVFSSADISYVKWDMNRTFSDYFSSELPPERQGEAAHRYVIGVYRCMKELTSRFPDILFEGCASGGNRFDLGILCYFPQIWASDNTDAYCRTAIQTGYSYGYPMSVVAAHVSGCPNHQTLRRTPLETRFAVAAFGILGYECNFCDLKKEDAEAVKQQIALYKKWRDVLQWGTFYRGRCMDGENAELASCTEWTCVSADKRKAVGFTFQPLVTPNSPDSYYRPSGLNEEYKYHFYNRELKYDIRDFGDLVNTVSPVHIRQDSFLHNMAAKFVKMNGETEDYTAYGDTLMYAGVRLKQNFCGTGFNENVRFYQDFAARMYFMEAVEGYFS